MLSAFEALAEHVPARLTVVGASMAEVARYVTEPAAARRIDAVGRVDQDELWRRLHDADVLCAPSLSGESFGMILTEAFAAGTPVIASSIAGYAEVVTDGVDGVLVPPGDAQRLAEELQRMHHEPASALGDGGGRQGIGRGDSPGPSVAERVESVYERALAGALDAESPQSRGRRDYLGARSAGRAGIVPIDGSPRRPARRLPPLASEPQPTDRGARVARRAGLAAAALAGAALTYLAATRIGFDNVGEAVIRSDLNWVLAAAALMVASMLLRAESWLAIARSAMPRARLRRRDVTSATMVGVLMSATLPARLGEPARAMVLARRAGRVRETFPVLLGTLVSQTVLNLVALAILGAIIVGSTDLFSAGTEHLFLDQRGAAADPGRRPLRPRLGRPRRLRARGADHRRRPLRALEGQERPRRLS